jgi:antirestriction protein ArdC
VSSARCAAEAQLPVLTERLLANWLSVLKNDKRAIFTAAAHALRAADYLHGLQ